MMLGLIITAPNPRRRPWWQRAPKLTLRQLAIVVSMLQVAEMRDLHANAESCLSCKISATMMRRMAMARLPKRYASNGEWMHRHVIMPGSRMLARLNDAHERGEL